MDIITDKSFKYNVETLGSTSDEFILVKEFHDITRNSQQNNINLWALAADFKIYKLNENSPTKIVEEKRNNLMLFHGTNRKHVDGILKEGFKNSERGWFGKGVYMTDCSHTALYYSSRSLEPYHCKRHHCVFVNEVLESEKLQTFQIVKDWTKPMEDIDTPLANPFNKHIYEPSAQATEENYKKDLKGRKYRNIANTYNSAGDEYVADESVTIPRYLIIFEYESKR